MANKMIRDTSIQACSANCVLKPQLEQLSVFLRIKPLINAGTMPYSVSDPNTLLLQMPESSQAYKNRRMDDNAFRNKYTFSGIFGPDSTQDEIFDTLVKPKLDKFLAGRNCNVMTYGISGSGKTYTLIGTASEPGIIPRSLEYIFHHIPKPNKYPQNKVFPNNQIERLSKQTIQSEMRMKEAVMSYVWPNLDRNHHINLFKKMQQRLSSNNPSPSDTKHQQSVDIWLSFVEVYNENVHDLLQPEPRDHRNKKNLKIGGTSTSTYVKELKKISVSTSLEAYQVLQYGIQHLNYAKTNINAHSSRSHSIFTIEIIETDHRNIQRVSRFSFCDLAGAERSKKANNLGARMKESHNINTSLMILGKCIGAIHKSQKSQQQVIPFRESKLTQILQSALLGFEDIFMIVNVNPAANYFDETVHVLNFSAIAREIEVVKQPPIQPRRETLNFASPEPNPQPSTSAERTIAELSNQIDFYLSKIDELKNRKYERMDRIKAEEINKGEELVRQMKLEYKEKNEQLKRYHRQRYRVRRKLLMQKHKVYDHISSSSEYSTSEEEEEPELNISFVNLCSSDEEEGETPASNKDSIPIIVIDSSDEDDDGPITEEKLKILQGLINQHHETIKNLKKKIDEKKAAKSTPLLNIWD